MTYDCRFSAASFLIAILLVGAGVRGGDQTADTMQEQGKNAARDNARREAENLVATERAKEFVAAAKLTSESLGVLETKVSEFSKLRTDLLTSDKGKRIALDNQGFAAFVRISEEPLPTIKEVEAKKNTVDAIRADIEKSLTAATNLAVAIVPPPSMTDEIAIDRLWASTTQARIEYWEQALNAAIAAQKDAPLGKAISLQQRFDAYHLAEVESLAKSRFSAVDAARPESEQTVRDAARNAELARGKAEADRIIERQAIELKRIKSEFDSEMQLAKEKSDREIAELNQKLAASEAARTVMDAKADATRKQGSADAEQIRLRQKCQEPETKRLLAPFLATGLWQPGDKPNVPWTHDRGPVSLSALIKVGALQTTTRGLTELYVCGNATYYSWPYGEHPDKDRPKWGYPNSQAHLSQDDWQELRRTQALLNELGTTLVDLGMLAK